MALNYSAAEYLYHQQVWQAKYHTVEVVAFGGNEIVLGKDTSITAQVLRVRFMMLSEGVAPDDEGKFGKVFHLVQMFLGAHIEPLFKAGLVRVHDGVNAVVAPEAGIAIHAVFNSETPPMPKDVPIEDVITAAKTIAISMKP